MSAESMSRDVIASEDFDELKRCTSDIARLIELAESWKSRDTTFIAQRLLDTLRNMLALDLVYLKLDGTGYAFIRTGDGIDPKIGSEETPGHSILGSPPSDRLGRPGLRLAV